MKSVGFPGLHRLVLSLFLLLVCQPAFAEKRVALVLSNAAYQNVAPLPNPVNDGSLIAATLKDAGFDVVDFRRDLSAVETRRVLRDFADRTRDADIALVYYAGHGIEVDGGNYLIPVDARLERDTDVYDEAFSLDRVLIAIEPAKKLRLVILDACRDNPFAVRMNRSLATRAATLGGLGRIEPTGNVLVAYAARDGTTALDGDARNSPFAAALLRNIEAPGVEVTFMFRNVRDDVMEATRNQQQPFVYGSLSRKAIYLAGPPPAGADGAALPAVVSPAAPRGPSSTIDPALVGTWEIMVPNGRGQSRWIWEIMGDGTYRFHAEPQRSARPHEGTITAANGRWTLRALRGLSGYSDGGAYEIHDAMAVITGKLGTGAWKRSAE
jgi:hypothetical protein